MLFEEPIRARNLDTPYQVAIEWRNGTLLADEPVSVGGQDKGPDPYTLLLSSLASCTLSTLRMYANRKQWDINGLRVALNMYQLKEPELQTVIERSIFFPEIISEEQRIRLLQIAEQCPVSKILKHTIQVQTEGNTENASA